MSQKRATRLLVLPLLLASIAEPAFGQASRPPREPETVPRASATVELSLYNLDVVVTDADGKPVHGLTAADFEVRHGGRKVEVTNFSEFRSDLPEPTAPSSEALPDGPAPSAAPSAPRPPRRVVLFFDRLSLPEPTTRKTLFDSLRSLLASTLDEGDEAMIVTWERSIRTVLPFSDDLDALEAALARIERRSARLGTEQADFEQIQSEEQWFSWLEADPRVGGEAGPSLLKDVQAQQAYFEMRAKCTALRGLAATLGGAEGRKVLVVVSHRFSRYPGLEFFLGYRPTPEEVLGARARVADARSLLDEVTAAANANGVSLYTLLPAELDTSTPTAMTPGSAAAADGAPGLGARGQAMLDNEMQALDHVARGSGGVADSGPTNVGRFVERIASDLVSWYSLGFPARAGETGVAPVSVRTKDRRLTARARSSLVEKSLEEQMADRVLAHLFRPDGRARIPISADVTGISAKAGRSRLHLEVRVPIASLALLPGEKGASGSFSVFVAAVGPQGDFSSVSRRRQPFEIPAKDLDAAKAGHYTFELELEAARDARLSVGVWDEKGGDAGFAVVRPAGPGG